MLAALHASGKITELKEQVKFVLVAGREDVAGVSYVADFTYLEHGRLHVLDAKGYKNAIYRLKKRLMFLIHNIRIEEV
jgi:hypothetical protein